MSERTPTTNAPVLLGRYALYDEIASGGMATMHIGRLIAAGGFARTVAIKRLHRRLASEREFVAMFLDEARLASRIRHPNVIATIDVVNDGDENFLVMEYVLGENLAHLIRRAPEQRVPIGIAKSILVAVLHGLHAAHQAKDERGQPIDIVHRDVSPQNILVGVDGIARVLDFGIAKARGRLHETRDGGLRGKLPYMAPEQLAGEVVDRRCDIWAASVVLWEALTGEQLFTGDGDVAISRAVFRREGIEPPSASRPEVEGALDGIVLRGLEREPERRYATAREMAGALERLGGLASMSEVGEWVQSLSDDVITMRANRIAEIESLRLEMLDTLAVTEPDVRLHAVSNAPAASTSQISLSRPAPIPPRASRSLGVAALLALAALVAVFAGLRRGDTSAPSTAKVVAGSGEATTSTPAVASASAVGPRSVSAVDPPPASGSALASAPAASSSAARRFAHPLRAPRPARPARQDDPAPAASSDPDDPLTSKAASDRH